jgi:hypothetical protein
MNGFRRRNQRADSSGPSEPAESPEQGGSFAPPPAPFDPASFDPPGPFESPAPFAPPAPFEASGSFEATGSFEAGGSFEGFESFEPPVPPGPFEPFGVPGAVEPATPAPDEPVDLAEAAGSPGESPELVRPYVITNGRGLEGTEKFNLITLVTAADRPRPAHLDPEKHRLLDLCGGGMLSVAEIAGHMRLPIGIVKVLLSDLSTEGYLVVRPPVPRAQLADVSLLQEVLDGLQARFG